MRHGLIVAALLFLLACGRQDDIPADVLPGERMGNVLFEITMAEAFLENYVFRDSTVKRDSALRRELETVLQANRISQESFRKSYAWYKQHPAVFRVVVDTMYARSQRSQEKLYGRRPKGRSFVADTTDTQKRKNVLKSQ
jgi:hypothetical protein